MCFADSSFDIATSKSAKHAVCSMLLTIGCAVTATSAAAPLEIAPLTQLLIPPNQDQGPPILAIKFSHADLAAVASLVGLQSICSTKQHDGSDKLYLLEQLTFLDR